MPVQIRGPGGQPFDLDATIDTGFSGFLTLPHALIAALQLSFSRSDRYVLGDNTRVTFDVYAASVIWDGQDHPVSVLAANGSPLVGMSLLHGYHLFVDVIDGGEVRIAPRP